MNPAAPIAQAIAEGFKLLKTIMDTSEVRKMRGAIEAAEKYIQVNEKNNEFKGITDDKQKKYLRHYSRRFFKLN